MLSIGKLGEGQADYYCGRRAGVEGDALHAALDGEHPERGVARGAARWDARPRLRPDLLGNTKATQEGRMIDLGDLLLALTEGWPEDLLARAFTELGISSDRLRRAVEAARQCTD